MDDQQSADVWMHAEERYQAGQMVQGVVTRLTQFGVFVQVEPNLEGVVYMFELGPGPSAQARFTPGQQVQLFVKNIDASRRRLELSLNNDPMPGLLDEQALPPDIRESKYPDRPAWPSLPPLPNFARDMQNAPPEVCATCQRPLQANWKFCVYCGSSLQRRCPSCGRPQPDLPGARFCYACGKPVL